VYPALLEDAFDLVRGDQRARRIMDGNVAYRRFEMTQAGPNGVLAMFATRNERPNFFEIFIAGDCLDLRVSVFTCDHNDLVDRGSALKYVYGVRDNRSAGDRRKQLVETHAATLTGSDDDGG
jgi:hypothetical protein